MSTVGDRIKARRTELGWTQDQLAQKAGISKSFLSDLENSKRSVSADTLLGLAQSLNLSLDFLMTGHDPKGKPPEVQIPASLAKFAEREGLTFRQAVALLKMREQIIAHRSTTKKEGLEAIDWQRFYERVREFLE